MDKSGKSRLEGAPLPALLGAAQRAYGSALRAGLVEAGFDDMPRAGIMLVGALARRESNNVSGVAGAFGISKQATSQLVDTMVERGYCERTADTADRRRMTVHLTDRGRSAARVIRSAMTRLNGTLTEHVSERDIAGTRATLRAIVELGRNQSPTS